MKQKHMKVTVTRRVFSNETDQCRTRRARKPTFQPRRMHDYTKKHMAWELSMFNIPKIYKTSISCEASSIFHIRTDVEVAFCARLHRKVMVEHQSMMSKSRVSYEASSKSEAIQLQITIDPGWLFLWLALSLAYFFSGLLSLSLA